MTTTAQNVVARFRKLTGLNLAEAAKAAYLAAYSDPRKAQRFGDDVSDAYDSAIGEILSEWAKRIGNGQTKLKPVFRALSPTSRYDSYEQSRYGNLGPEYGTSYSCEANYPSIVRVTYKVKLNPADILKKVLRHNSFGLDDREAAQLLASPSIQQAVPAFVEKVAHGFDEPVASYLLKKVEDIGYDEVDIRTDSDDPDEVEVAAWGEAIVHPQIGSPWKVSIDNLIATFTANIGIDVEIRWQT